MTGESVFRMAFTILLALLFAMRFYLVIADCPQSF